MTPARTLRSHPTRRPALAAFALALLLSACGGGAGEASPTSPGAEVPAVVSIAISSQPAEQSVVRGGTAVFSVAASVNTGVLAVQWQAQSTDGQSWNALAGETAMTLRVTTSSTSPGAQWYRAVLTAGGQSLTTSAARLAVTEAVLAAQITVDPQDTAVTAGQNTSFAVTAQGTALQYAWQASSDGTAWSNLPVGGDASVLTLTAPTLADNGRMFRVVVSNGLGAVTSQPARLSVTAAPAAPSFTSQPTDASVLLPTGVAFTVAGQGQPAPTLQWQRSNDNGQSYNNVAGATGTTLALPGTAAADDGAMFRVLAGNVSGSTLSAAARLRVTAAAVAPTASVTPAAFEVDEGSTVTVTAAVGGSPSPQLQWQISTDGGASFGNLAGATGTSLSLVANNANSGALLRVVASNAAASAISGVTRLQTRLSACTAVTSSKSGQLIAADLGQTQLLSETSSRVASTQYALKSRPGTSHTQVVASGAKAATLVPDLSGDYLVTATNLDASGVILAVQDHCVRAGPAFESLAPIGSLTADQLAAAAQLAQQKTCTACHAAEQNLVGPSYRAIATKYAGQSAAAANLARKTIQGGAGVWGTVPMPANPALTREEAAFLTAWVLQR